MSKKITLTIPDGVFGELETISKKYGITPKIVMTQMLKLGLIASVDSIYLKNEEGDFYEVFPYLVIGGGEDAER